MCMDKTPWERVCEFHGHVCPGLALGFRATTLALEKLDISRSVDEEMIASVENNACGVDAVQVLSGCTFGKGNLFFIDHGKQVYTFARRSYGKAVRISVKYGSFYNETYSSLRVKINSGEATGEEKRDFMMLQQKHIQNILEAGEEFFDISFVDIELPPKAKIHKSVRCDKCGESVMETRTVSAEGKTLCIPCGNH